ncbi:MAG: DNRLRE domain-containing protein [Candidatus Cloacimonetes bacterium]|nr:DNRLRE domain-containing protein [Candidatus Cloacimonadota bacterium]MCF7813409.1 DNRLRE domain-containing protein [Candidatus Cloacimonadota bacterium]MCF7867702.1 DNRLRE domain-containing protein [Candidatus Cloacimonadota bacterium]MCF7883212.1 DNRLRE domain-containing protein [Candidatus Cloacimonadota bacterium]
MKKFIITIMISIFAVSIFCQEVQIAPSDDMYTDCITGGAAHPEAELYVNCETATEEEQIMMRFDVSGLMGIFIESATLNIHRFFSCGGGGGITSAMIYRINEEWDEDSWDEHTFIQYVDTSGFPFSFSGPAGTQDTWFQIDLTDYVNHWLYANEPNYGFVIIADAGQRHSKFNSKEAVNADLQPFLNVTLDTAADDVLNPITSLSNYPNPFNPSTTISFNLTTGVSEDAEMTIFNLKGQIVKRFSNLQISQSTDHQIVWNGKDDSGKAVSSGIYNCRLEVGNHIQTRKISLIK